MAVLIVDDEQLARRRIRRLLSGVSGIKIVGECKNGSEAVTCIRSERPDLVFLDVQMPGMDGFAVLKALEPEEWPSIVFVTAYDQYAVRAFEVNALDYLLKPFDKDRFDQSLARARRQFELGSSQADPEKLLALLSGIKPPQVYEPRILVRNGDKAVLVETDQIFWVESSGNYVVLHTASDHHLLRRTMKAMEDDLDPRVFRRVHRHIIVNITRIKELRAWGQGEYEVTLSDGTKVPVSRRYRQNLDQAL
jgi:two-component system LytT family response regulator